MEEKIANNSGMINLVAIPELLVNENYNLGSDHKHRIEELRQDLILLAIDKGLTNTDVLRVSQELDEAINAYLKETRFGPKTR